MALQPQRPRCAFGSGASAARHAGDLDVVAMKDVPNGLGLYLNKASAEKMGVTLPKAVLDRALKVF